MRKNVLCNLLTIMMVSVFSLVLSSSSCHNDDDDMKENEVSLVGTWRHDFRSGYVLLIFRSDGTGRIEEYDFAEGDKIHSSEISYYYDENKERYVLIFKELENTYYCPVLYVNETTLAFINPDDKTETYTRVSK